MALLHPVGVTPAKVVELADHLDTLEEAVADRTRDLEEVAAACRQLGATVSTQAVDVTDTASVNSWLVRADEQLPVDILIANAGMGGNSVVTPREGESAVLAQEIFNVNTIGVTNTIAPLVPAMSKRGRGNIVIIGSMAAMVGLPHSPVYSASKAAIQIYSDGMRRLLQDQGIRVTSVLPGFIDTPMSQSLNMERPFCWSAEKAAKRIARDVARGSAYSIFPWQFRLLLALQSVLPTWIIDRILIRSAKAGWDEAA